MAGWVSFSSEVDLGSEEREQNTAKPRAQLVRWRSKIHLHRLTIAVALAARQESKVDAGTNSCITLALLPCLVGPPSPPLFTPTFLPHRVFSTRPSPNTFLSLQLQAVSHSLSFCSSCISALQHSTRTPREPSLHNTVTSKHSTTFASYTP